MKTGNRAYLVAAMAEVLRHIAQPKTELDLVRGRRPHFLVPIAEGSILRRKCGKMGAGRLFGASKSRIMLPTDPKNPTTPLTLANRQAIIN
jgi:hypothetical protein